MNLIYKTKRLHGIEMNCEVCFKSLTRCLRQEQAETIDDCTDRIFKRYELTQTSRDLKG